MRLEFFGGSMERNDPLLSQATYATIRISEGVSVFKLAADMGTSIEMIESFFSTARSECATLR